MYRAPEKAYAAMDFTGRGYITDDDFLNSMILNRIQYTRDDVKEFFKQNNLFTIGTSSQGGGNLPTNSMNFDTFKKTFFPHLYLI